MSIIKGAFDIFWPRHDDAWHFENSGFLVPYRDAEPTFIKAVFGGWVSDELALREILSSPGLRNQPVSNGFCCGGEMERFGV